MQWKVDPTSLHVMFPFELFNTNCTEVTPGSNIVRKNLDQNLISIFICIQWVTPLSYSEFAQEFIQYRYFKFYCVSDIRYLAITAVWMPSRSSWASCCRNHRTRSSHIRLISSLVGIIPADWSSTVTTGICRSVPA